MASPPKINPYAPSQAKARAQQPPAELGKHIASFRASASSVWGFGMLMVLGIAVGGGLLYGAFYIAQRDAWNLPFLPPERGTCWIYVIVLILFGLVTIAVFFRLLLNVLASAAGRYEMCEQGFRYIKRDAVETLLWSNIPQIVEEITTYRASVHPGRSIPYTPKQVVPVLIVHSQRSRKHEFNGNMFEDYGELKQLLRQKAAEYNIRWTKKQITQ